MYNANLIQKICNSRCSLDELESFCSELDKKEFDLDNSFQKYYSLNAILNVFKKFYNKEISCGYLVSWANAYNWIIMATSWSNCEEKNYDLTNPKMNFNLVDRIENVISDMLDALSFFEYNEVNCISSMIIKFKLYDRIYNSIDEWNNREYFNRVEDCLDCYNLIVNDTEKLYYVFSIGAIYQEDAEAINMIDEIKQECEHLIDRGYKILKIEE